MKKKVNVAIIITKTIASLDIISARGNLALMVIN